MILKWFDSSKPDDFARSLAAEMRQLFDPVTRRSGNPQKRQAKAPQKLEKVLARAAAFQAEHHLNFYRKARLLNTLKWELKEHGYDPAFVDDIVEMVTRRIS